MIMVEMLACWLKNDRAPRLIPSKDLLSRVKDGNKLGARVEVATGQVGQLLVRVRLHLLLMDFQAEKPSKRNFLRQTD